MKKLLFLFMLILTGFISLPSSAFGHVLKVAVTDGAPFSSYHTVASGIAVDLWESIAHQNHWHYKFIPVGENIEAALSDLSKKKYDLLIGPISTTTEREARVDFSRPFYISETGLIIHAEKASSWIVLIHLFEAFFAQTSIIFFILCLVFTHLYWFFEYKHNPSIPNTYVAGISYTLWHVFYHLFKGGPLHVPKTIKTRILLIIWMLTALFFFISLTATLTSSLTISLAENEDVNSTKELQNKKLAVISGTTGLTHAKRVDSNIIRVKSLKQGIELLEKNQVFGVIEDRQIANDFLAKNNYKKLFISHLNLGYNELTFAFPQGSRLKEKVDRGLMSLQDKGIAKTICARYVGDMSIYCDF